MDDMEDTEDMEDRETLELDTMQPEIAFDKLSITR
jgi:hypothetical protein